MSAKKVIAIMGATGAQGNGLVRAIAEDPSSEFQARAITRNAGSDAAKELATLGVEVVEADLDNPASIEAAFAGAYGAYCVTFFWEHHSPEKEAEHVRTMAAAAKQSGLSHVIWSTLEDTRDFVPLDDDRMPTLWESYKVPHYDAKGAADVIFRDAAVPTTFLRTSFYWENMLYFEMGPKRNGDGALAFVLPIGDGELPGIAAADIGRAAYGVFKRPELIGQTVSISGENLTGNEIAAALGNALGETVNFEPLSADVYRGLGFPGAEDLGNMFQFVGEFESYAAARDRDATLKLNPQLQSFSTWLEANAKQLPLG